MSKTPPFRPLLQAIDLHLVAMLVILLTIGAFGPRQVWVLVVLTVIPQGRILTRVFDLTKMQRATSIYLIANELLVGGALLVCVGAWHYTN